MNLNNKTTQQLKKMLGYPNISHIDYIEIEQELKTREKINKITYNTKGVIRDTISAKNIDQLIDKMERMRGLLLDETKITLTIKTKEDADKAMDILKLLKTNF